MKKLLFLLAFFSLSCSINLFADDVIHPFTKLSFIKTEYFDIIYPEESEQTAFYLADVVDGYYEKATAFLNAQKDLHLPVVICPCTQDLNAHYSPVPYPHICLYDTLQTASGDLYSKESMNEVFYHELIHAVSLTIATPETKKITKFFWPDFSVNLVALNNSWFEGATVSGESKDGFGRLNNGFVWSYLVQAKIEDKFPNFYELASRDIYPSGQYTYYFGGAFANYLQETYGQETYAKFWNQGDNTYLPKKLVKKTLGAKYWEVWENFEDSIAIPPLAPSETVQECFGDFASNVAVTTIDGKENIVFYSVYKSGIYTMIPGKKAKKLLDTDTKIQDLAFSKDGHYLVITDFAANNSENLRLRVYDMLRHRFTGKKLIKCKLGEIFTHNGKEFLVCIENNSTDSSINIYDLETMSLETKLPLKHFSEVTELCHAENGFAFIMHHDGEFYFNYADISNGIKKPQISSFAFPKEVIPYYLNADDTDSPKKVFLCSTAGHGLVSENTDFPAALARLTKIELDESGAFVQFQKMDVSGGVYNPAKTTDGEYYFASSLAERKPLAKFTDKATVPGGFSIPYEMPLTQTTAFDFQEKTLSPQFQIEAYKPAKYTLKGLLLPYIMPADTFAYCPINEHLANPMYFGAGYYTGLPSENFYISFGGGYDPLEKLHGFSINALGGTKNFAYSLISDASFYNYTFHKANIEADARGSLPLFSSSFAFQYQAEALLEIYSKNLFCNTNNATIGFSYAKRRGMGTYESFKIISAATIYNSSITGTNIGLAAQISLPKLLPFRNPWSFTLNLPARFTFHLIPDNATLMHGNCNLTVFGKEIQKQPGNSSLYFSKMYLTAGFDSCYFKKMDPMSILKVKELVTSADLCNQTHAITSGFHVEWTPVIGTLASVHVDCGCDVKFYLLNQITKIPYDISFSIGAQM